MKFKSQHLIQALVLGATSIVVLTLVHWALWQLWDMDRSSLDTDNLGVELGFFAVVIALATFGLAVGLGWYVIQEYRENHPTHNLDVKARCFDAYEQMRVTDDEGNAIRVKMLNISIVNSGASVPAVYSGRIVSVILRDVEIFWTQRRSNETRFQFDPMFEKAGGQIRTYEAVVKFPRGNMRATLIRFKSSGTVMLFPDEPELLCTYFVPQSIWDALQSEELYVTLDTPTSHRSSKVKVVFSDIALAEPVTSGSVLAKDGEAPVDQ